MVRQTISSGPRISVQINILCFAHQKCLGTTDICICIYSDCININIFLSFQGPPGSHKKFSDNGEMTEEERRQAKIEEETSYELMLKQQQLFLQWQLEMQSKVSWQLVAS